MYCFFLSDLTMNLRTLSLFFILEISFFILTYTSIYDYPESTVKSALLKILPILTLLFAVYQTSPIDAVHANLRKYFSLGLAFSLVGDIFMNWPKELLVPGMIFFSIAHIFYTAAFGLKPFGYEAASFCATSSFVSFLFVLPGIKERALKTGVFLYGGLISVTWWRTIVRWQQKPSLPNLIGAAGGLLFLISDFTIALDRWKYPQNVPCASAFIMVTYYLAQLLLTVSVTKYGWTLFSDEEIREKKKG